MEYVVSCLLQGRLTVPADSSYSVQPYSVNHHACACGARFAHLPVGLNAESFMTAF
jgi:hypothetical protein